MSQRGGDKYQMRKFIDIINEAGGALDEAPLADFDVRGDRDNEGSFAAPDVKAFNNERWLKKVENHFSRTPYDFHIYLFNAPKGEFKITRSDGSVGTFTGTFLNGRLTTQDQFETLEELVGRVPVNRDGISIVMTDNEGSDKITLTPWILAHRVAHALLIDTHGFSPASRFYLVTNDLVNKISDDDIPYGDVLKFKSAANQETRVGELCVDLLTQYIVQGSITIKGDRYADLVQGCNEASKNLLDSAVGGYFVVSGRPANTK